MSSKKKKVKLTLDERFAKTIRKLVYSYENSVIDDKFEKEVKDILYLFEMKIYEQIFRRLGYNVSLNPVSEDLLSPKVRSLTTKGLKQAKQGKGKPIDFDLDDDNVWLDN